VAIRLFRLAFAGFAPFGQPGNKATYHLGHNLQFLARSLVPVLIQQPSSPGKFQQTDAFPFDKLRAVSAIEPLDLTTRYREKVSTVCLGETAVAFGEVCGDGIDLRGLKGSLPSGAAWTIIPLAWGLGA
jgi:hypothetical protein